MVATKTYTAAKSALMRKKQHEHSLNQTTAQIATIEQQVYSIEAANINQETLKAMEKAGKAMSQIHGGLSIDKVDETMDKLREQHALGQEIAQAITSSPIGETVDQDELEAELGEMEQEALDERMTNTGTVPVADRIDGLPNVANGEGPSSLLSITACRFIADTTPLGQSNRIKPGEKKKTRKPNSPSCRPRWPCDPIPSHLSHLPPSRSFPSSPSSSGVQ